MLGSGLAVKFRNIADTIWSDPGFSDLSSNAKLIWLFCLTNPNLNLIGIFHAPDQIISAYTGLGKDAVLRCVEELERAGMIRSTHGYLIMINYAKYNVYRDHNTLRGARLAFASIPDEVWLVAMQYERIDELYDLCIGDELTREEQRRVEMLDADEPEPERKKEQPKPKIQKPDPKPEPELSQLGKVIKEECQRLIDITDGSLVARPTNRKCTLTHSEIEKLVEYAKQNCGSIEAEKLARQLVREFYTWKFTAEKAVKSDYLSMIKPWVLEKAQKHFANPNRNGQIAPEPERRGGMYTQQETDPASDNHYRSHPEMTDPRIGKKWGEMSKEEIDNMIKSRRYDENGKRMQK
jgi:hypothetical protein